MTGKIIRGVGGFYYVYVEGDGIYECRARGIFRRENTKPLAGDLVTMHVTDPTDREGSLDTILPRKNTLLRPAVANVDQVLLMFAAASPEPNLNLLDRFLVYMASQDIPVILCFNKADLADEAVLERYRQIYSGSDLTILFISVRDGRGVEELRSVLSDKTTALVGPSGVGKSSLTNLLIPEAQMEVGDLSKKIDRGKQTTRHTELNRVASGTYLFDTPGFSSLWLIDTDERSLRDAYPEFRPYSDKCRFAQCMHISEPDCAVKEAVEKGEISRVRYDNYLLLHEELKEQKKY